VLAEGLATAARIDEMQKECAKIIDDAVDWAEQQPYPSPEEVTRDVYYEG
jgi:TPP-dependent pyruvate/acetoin dehydrogenase alpha subunit